MKFEWKYCPTCETMMVICPQCGNNTCNGGVGMLDDGSTCNTCNLAYQFYAQAVETNSVPEFPDNKDDLDEEYKMWWKNNFSC